jgi:hypothetical protein
MVTAKIKLVSKGEPLDGQVQLFFDADYDDDRNREWAKYTPGLNLQMNVMEEVADHFEVGKPITLEFVEDDSTPAAPAPAE